MNNNLYHLQSEHAVRYEMHEVDLAVEQARLLREAGLAGPSWRSHARHAVHALGNLLNALRKGVEDRRSIAPRTYHEKSPRSV